ncbi:nitrate reductase cytochrome c-type subunit [Halarcobacter ebronensis]|uniref:Periplasmic nitrate reductase, electron transfer subunit n=1 Tax=Halarcobacter ebronensis TaxID=1462615 RepID=A0A4Q1AR96_9BACT|nr:nitrate reductase cytochrome c-type subunit [Halarcobacter ebronensis]QKF82670.1 periplasmic nitrate reductase NapAB, small subunit, periplasmic diheme cytochrome c550 protein [Halarcobacter ebronensis]RXK02092.1 nitrate reductase [Halarcobacter ebronensis]
MKLVTKLGFGLAVTSFIVFIGCSQAQPTYSEESLGLRKVDLYSESSVIPDKTEYNETAPSTGGKTLDRAFQDAPPMIPHSVDGMLPITVDNNQCVGCHAPEVAPSLGALPYPQSHMINFRPDTSLAADGKITKNGKEIDNTSSEKLADVSIKKLASLSGARFNCSQCHAPQSKGQLVENTFQPDYTTEDGAKKSDWSGSKLTEGLDTLLDK